MADSLDPASWLERKRQGEKLDAELRRLENSGSWDDRAHTYGVVPAETLGNDAAKIRKAHGNYEIQGPGVISLTRGDQESRVTTPKPLGYPGKPGPVGETKPSPLGYPPKPEPIGMPTPQPPAVPEPTPRPLGYPAKPEPIGMPKPVPEPPVRAGAGATMPPPPAPAPPPPRTPFPRKIIQESVRNLKTVGIAATGLPVASEVGRAMFNSPPPVAPVAAPPPPPPAPPPPPPAPAAQPQASNGPAGHMRISGTLTINSDGKTGELVGTAEMPGSAATPR